MTVRECAAATGIQMWRLRALLAAGRGPRYFRIGRVIRMRARDVETWLEEQTKQRHEGGQL
jgi:excisionase family DNA binding protein